MSKTLTPAQQLDVMRLRPLALHIARDMRPGDDDFSSQAVLLLCEAVLRYDPRRGVGLDEFVGWEMRNRLLKYCAKNYPPDSPRRASYRGSLPAFHRDVGGPSVEEAIAALPQPSQSVVLARASGCTWRATSKATGIPVGECKRLFREAKVELRKSLAQRYEK